MSNFQKECLKKKSEKIEEISERVHGGFSEWIIIGFSEQTPAEISEGIHWSVCHGILGNICEKGIPGEIY